MMRRLLLGAALVGLLGGMFAAAPALAADAPAAEVMMTKVNVNSATQDELATLPGVGDKIAKAIVVYRDDHGAFKNIEELKEVKGIGEKKLELMRERVILE